MVRFARQHCALALALALTVALVGLVYQDDILALLDGLADLELAYADTSKRSA